MFNESVSQSCKLCEAAQKRITELERNIETLKYGATKLIQENENLCEKNDKLEERLQKAEKLLNQFKEGKNG